MLCFLVGGVRATCLFIINMHDTSALYVSALIGLGSSVSRLSCFFPDFMEHQRVPQSPFGRCYACQVNPLVNKDYWQRLGLRFSFCLFCEGSPDNIRAFVSAIWRRAEEVRVTARRSHLHQRSRSPRDFQPRRAPRHYFGPGRASQPGGGHRVAGHINFQGERRMGSAHRNIADAEGSSPVFPAVASSLAGSLAGCTESSVSYYESLQHNEEAEQHLAENAHSHNFGDEEVHGIANPYL